MFAEALEKVALLLDTIDRLTQRSDLHFGSEADVTAFALTRLSLLHLMGVVDLGRAGADRFVPACAVGRAAFETAVTAAWLSLPGEMNDRQLRWLRWVNSAQTYYTRVAGYFENDLPDLAANLRLGAHVFDNWERVVREQLAGSPKGDRISVELMLTDLGRPTRYLMYRNASQPVHGTPDGLRWVWRLQDPQGDERCLGIWAGSDGEVQIAFDNYSTEASWASILGPAAYAVGDAALMCLEGQRASDQDLADIDKSRGYLNEALHAFFVISDDAAD